MFEADNEIVRVKVAVVVSICVTVESPVADTNRLFPARMAVPGREPTEIVALMAPVDGLNR